jgi:hypothetical protein
MYKGFLFKYDIIKLDFAPEGRTREFRGGGIEENKKLNTKNKNSKKKV